MRTKHLIAAAALVGAVLAGLGQAHADLIGDYTFDDPTGVLDTTQDYASDPPGGGDITATGEDPTNLFGKNAGPGEQGVGIAGTMFNEIVPGTFVQLDLIDLTIPPLTSPLLSFRAGSVQPPDAWEVFATNVADTLAGATLILSGTDSDLDPLGVPIIGVFRYLDVTASTGDILVAEITAQFTPPLEPVTPAPEPASLALLGTALLGVGVLRRRRR